MTEAASPRAADRGRATTGRLARLGFREPTAAAAALAALDLPMVDPATGDPTPDGAVVLAALGRAAEPDLALTALARVLDGVRERGHALVDEELEEGLRSIAVPVHDRTGRVVAALNVALHAARRTVEECERDILPELRATADRIEGDLRVAGRFTRVPVS